MAYRARSGDSRNWAENLIPKQLREYGISSGERKLIAREIEEAAKSDKFRLRTAAAFAATLTGEENYLPLLQKLAKDKAYALSEVRDNRRAKQILFPVRIAAVAGLARFGISADSSSGEFSGKELDKLRRGQKDVTKERGNLRDEFANTIYISPLDFATAPKNK